MSRTTNRRQFLMHSAAAAGGAGLLAASRGAVYGYPANEKLNIAVIGVGGQGRDAWRNESVKENNVVALVDIDDRAIYNAAETHPMAEKYNDFRVMYDKQHKGIDAIVCATPDHTHAVATAAALRLGKHAYTQKPLTHTVYEAHVLSELAKANPKLATQMGNQGHSNEGARRVVEIVRSGAVGPIKEVHAWTNRPIWPQSIDRPTETPPVPSHVHWDLWLGPMADRPYSPAYHPFAWRGWWDFGTGALGDMACHICDTAFWALELKHPVSIESTAEGVKPETAPKSCKITYQFPERGKLPPVTLHWYDANQKPPMEIAEKYGITPGDGKRGPTAVKKKDGKPVIGFSTGGSLLVGEKGAIYLPGDYGADYLLLPEKDFADYVPPPKTLTRSPGHYKDWIDAAKNGTQACSNFEYASALTGMVLLGNLSVRAGKKIDWDAANMRATNASEVDEFIRPQYRKGWSL